MIIISPLIGIHIIFIRIRILIVGWMIINHESNVVSIAQPNHLFVSKWHSILFLEPPNDRNKMVVSAKKQFGMYNVGHP